MGTWVRDRSFPGSTHLCQTRLFMCLSTWIERQFPGFMVRDYWTSGTFCRTKTWVVNNRDSFGKSLRWERMIIARIKAEEQIDFKEVFHRQPTQPLDVVRSRRWKWNEDTETKGVEWIGMELGSHDKCSGTPWHGFTYYNLLLADTLSFGEGEWLPEALRL